ncbi:hypothetical protein ACTUHY_00500 [Acidaminococcus sp. LBK-2]|uniref:hypothetical protein n=1 Tax=Acidaminococcus sp. LBK-2 TaxID=3456956 RepID=UPI003FA41056
MDLNINIKLTCDDYMVRLVDTVVRSLDAIDGAVAPMVKAPATKPTTAPALAAQPQQAAPKAASVQQTGALFPPAPVVQQTPAPAPTPQPAPVVPTAPARTYSLNDLLTAAAPLMDQGKFQELSALTAKYGVKSFTDIPEDQYGNVAVDLRALGAAL